MASRFLAHREDIAATLFLGLIALALFLPILFKPDTLIYNSDITFFFPHEVVIENSITQGNFPLWNPYFGAGSPSMSKIQTGLLYPPMGFLRLLLPIVARLNWNVVLHVFVAGLGVFWLVRDIVTNRTAALFSALAFMLSGSIIPRVTAGHLSVLQTIVWIGWLLFVYRRLLARHSWWYLLLTVIFSTFVLLGGHPQMSLIVLIVPVSYFVFVFAVDKFSSRQWSELARGFGLSFLVAVLAIGLTLAQMVPFFEWLSYTSRGAGEAFESLEWMTRHSIQPHHLVTLFMPLAWFQADLGLSINITSISHFWEISPFVGTITLFMCIVGLFTVQMGSKRHLILYLIGLALFGLIMSMGTLNPLYPTLLDWLPYLRVPGRFMLLWSFPLSILGGIFLDGLLTILQDPDRRSLFKKPAYLAAVLSFVGIVLIICWNVFDTRIITGTLSNWFLVEYDLGVVQRLLQRGTLILALTLALITALFWVATYPAVKAKIWAWLAIAVLLFEMALFTRPLIKPYPVSRLVDPQNPLALLQIDPGEVRIDGYRTPPNYLVPTLRHVRNGEEHVALLALLAHEEKGQQLLSASFEASDQPIEDPDMELIQQVDSAYLYRHVNTSPRLYASDSLTLVHSDSEALDFVMDDSFNHFARSSVTVSAADDIDLIREAGLERSATGDLEFSGEITSYEDDLIRARVTVDRPALVTFGELYYPGWQATVDGKEAPIFKSNYTFRGVVVTQGEHLIEMRYLPASFQLGANASLLTLVGMVGVTLWLLIKSARQGGPSTTQADNSVGQ